MKHLISDLDFPKAAFSDNGNGKKEEKSQGWLLRFLSPLLLFAPEVHLIAFQDIYIDISYTIRPRNDFASKMETSFAEYITYATIILNADVVYLAIPTVQGPSSSSASVACIASMIMSLGSIVTGLLLMRWRKSGGDYAEEVCKYLTPKDGATHNATRLKRRMERLAILCSLPYALLFWG